MAEDHDFAIDGGERKRREIIGKNVVRLRKLARLDQPELAQKAKTSVSTISRIERGNVKVSEGKLVDVANALGTSVAELERPARAQPDSSPGVPDSPPHTPVTGTDAAVQLAEFARVRAWSVEAVSVADRVRAAFALRELERAADELAKLSVLVDDPIVALARAEVAYRRGAYSDAREFARVAVDRDSQLLEAWILGFRASMASRDTSSAHRWLDALQRLFPRHPRTLLARAQLAWEDGEIGSLQAALAQVPDEAVFARDTDADLRRLLKSASVVVGDGRVSVMIGVFAGEGIRTILLGWRDPLSELPEPTISTRWRPNGEAARASVKLEPIESSGEVAIKGIRVGGMTERPSDAPELVGWLELRAEFGELEDTHEDAYGALMLVDLDRKLLNEPRRIWTHELRGIPRDDWLDRPRGWGAAPPPTSSARPPTVFIVYAREDIAQVDWLDRALREHGIQVWRDQRALRSGDIWPERIDEAIESSDFVVLCLSKISLTKRGHVQVELKRVLAEFERRPLGAAYLIPVRLDDVQAPRVLAEIHHVDLFPDRQSGADQVARHILSHWTSHLQPG